MPRLLAAMLALLTLVSAAAAEPPKKVAFFGVLLIDTSPGETSADEERRRAAMEARIVEAMTDSGGYVFVDTAPVAEKMNLYSNLSHCNGCDVRLASEIGAEIAMSGEVQKTSNLILSISLYMRDAVTGDLIGGGSADMRGNNDESWARGVDYILRNRILK